MIISFEKLGEYLIFKDNARDSTMVMLIDQGLYEFLVHLIFWHSLFAIYQWITNIQKLILKEILEIYPCVSGFSIVSCDHIEDCNAILHNLKAWEQYLLVKLWPFFWSFCRIILYSIWFGFNISHYIIVVILVLRWLVMH